MYDLVQRQALAAELASAFLTGPWTAEALAEAGAGSLNRWPSWMTALAVSVVAVHQTAPDNRRGELDRFIERFLAARGATDTDREPPQIIRLLAPAPTVAATAPTSPARLPPGRRPATVEIASVLELAERLELSDGQLAWLADVRGWERGVESEQLRNYRYRARPRAGAMPRVIEAPKARLKEIQRWLGREILDRVPAHEAAHGFVRGRSALTHARLHTGQAAVLRLDLKDFFPSVRAGRIYAIWRTLGYAPSVAHVLTGLTTNVVPAAVWQVIADGTPPFAVEARFALGRQLATPHLPQGAPTSPALANLAAFRLDVRLSGLAAASGLRYSRYADDLTFSGTARLHRHRDRFEALIARIVGAEGFALNPVKSAIHSQGGRQTVCGVVVNAHPNLRRGDFDRLKATLHNAVRHGPSGQNRAGVPDYRAHLLGRVAWAEAVNPARGAKLHRLFDQIDWP